MGVKKKKSGKIAENKEMQIRKNQSERKWI